MTQPSKYMTYSVGGTSLFAGVLFLALANQTRTIAIRALGAMLFPEGFWVAIKGR